MFLFFLIRSSEVADNIMLYNVLCKTDLVTRTISLNGIAASMRIHLKNNLEPWKKFVPLRTRICKKSIGAFFGDTLQVLYIL